MNSFVRDERGASAVLLAIMFPVILGGVGFGVETGYWYLKQRKLQHVADLAAHAAGIGLRSGGSQQDLEARARRIAEQSGIPPGEVSISVMTPPGSGPNSGSRGHVEVVLETSTPRMVTAVFGPDDIRFVARAVARVDGGGHLCVLSLSPSRAGAVQVDGSADLSLEGCSVGANSSDPRSFIMDGSGSSLAAECVYTAGGATTGTGIELECGKIVENAAPTPDPYAKVPEPYARHIPCRFTGISLLGTTYLTPLDSIGGYPAMRICSGMRVNGNVFLMPGIYIFDGGSLTVNAGASIRGSGVTLYLTGNARAEISGAAETDLSAPVWGAYQGMLIFGDRDDSVTHSVSGNSSSNLKGAIYAPRSAVAFSGSSSVTGTCVQIVADRVTFAGRASLTLDCGNTGMRDIRSGQTVALVE